MHVPYNLLQNPAAMRPQVRVYVCALTSLEFPHLNMVHTFLTFQIQQPVVGI